MLADATSRPPPSCLLFSSRAREVLLLLTYRYPVTLSYIIDNAGNEVVGIVGANDDEYSMAIAYPVPGGFCAEDASAGLLGMFETAEQLCNALGDHVRCFCLPNTLH